MVPGMASTGKERTSLPLESLSAAPCLSSASRLPSLFTSESKIFWTYFHYQILLKQTPALNVIGHLHLQFQPWH